MTACIEPDAATVPAAEPVVTTTYSVSTATSVGPATPPVAPTAPEPATESGTTRQEPASDAVRQVPRHRLWAQVTRLRAHRSVRWGAVIVLLAVEAALIAPHVSFGDATFDRVDWSLLLVAVLAEAVSIGTFARMRRRLLRVGGSSMSLRQMGVLTLASNAISATAPAGTPVSTAYLYQQLRRRGTDATVTTWVVVAGSVMSGVAFSVLTVAGALLDGELSIGEIVGAAGVSLLLGIGVVVGLAAASDHPEPLLRLAERVGDRLPARWRHGDTNIVHVRAELVLDRLATIAPRRRDWASVFVFAMLNWVADLACFVLCCYAVGARGFALGGIVLAYVAGLATIGITLTPGGLGTMEAGMLLGLANAGVAAPLAVAGVLAYRAVAYVLVGAVGWGAWAGIRRSQRPSAAPVVVLEPIPVGLDPA